MTERDCGHDDGDNAGVFYRPIEVEVDSRGQGKMFLETHVVGKDEETRKRVLEEFKKDTGSRELTLEESRSLRAFSSSKWKAPWNPTGPKPNWRRPPDNPSLN